MEIRLAPEFEKHYKKLPLSVKKRAEKQTDLFCLDTRHPSLHVEKLAPKRKEYWSLRVDKKYRIVFQFESKDVVYFMNIGEHDWIYNYVNRL